MHRATFAVNGRLIRPEPKECEYIDSDLAAAVSDDPRKIEDNIIFIVERYGDNPLTYPLPIFISYLRNLEKLI